MKKLLRILYIIAGMAAFAACSSDLSEESEYGSIAGSVSDRTTGEPVATVNVKLQPNGTSTVTGSDGTFSFNFLDEGTYTIEISKEGYRANTTEINVRRGDPTRAHLLIERIPSIVTADRETLDFGDNQSLNTLSFNIVNSSYEDLEWEIEERCDWIAEIKPEKGVLKYGKTEGIVVVIDRDKLNAGENKAVIVIRSSQGSSQMNVTAAGEERSLAILNVLSPTEITVSSAIFNGEIVNEGIPAYTERGFVYSLTSNPTIENTITKITSPVNSTNKYSCIVSDLTYNTTYYVRAYAKNIKGVAYSSNEISFTTPFLDPQVSTIAVDDADIENGTATFRGEVTKAGVPAYIERGFVYSTYPNPTINDEKVVANGKEVVGAFSKYVTGLPKTTYYVRAYATSAGGTVYGKEIKKEREKAIVTTGIVTNIDFAGGSAMFQGNITDCGNPPFTERGFVYGTSINPTIDDNKIVVSGSAKIGEYYIKVSNLPRKTYYVRAYVINSEGIAYGEDRIVEADWIEIPSAGIAVQKSDLSNGSRVDWVTAQSLCNNSTVMGFNDWRLPTKDELVVMYNNRDKLGEFVFGYWSSTIYRTDQYGTEYYVFDIQNGQRLSHNYTTYFYRVRAVRTLDK